MENMDDAGVIPAGWTPRFKKHRSYGTQDRVSGLSTQAKRQPVRNGVQISEQSKQEIVRLYREEGYPEMKLTRMEWRGNDGVVRTYHPSVVLAILADAAGD